MFGHVCRRGEPLWLLLMKSHWKRSSRPSDLKVLALPKPPDEIFIRSSDVNRPGLQLAGFFEVFDERRTQVLGESEIVFMNRYTEEEARSCTWNSSRPSFACNPGKGARSTPEHGGCGKADRYSAADHHREYLHLYLVADPLPEH